MRGVKLLRVLGKNTISKQHPVHTFRFQHTLWGNQIAQVRKRGGAKKCSMQKKKRIRVTGVIVLQGVLKGKIRHDFQCYIH